MFSTSGLTTYSFHSRKEDGNLLIYSYFITKTQEKNVCTHIENSNMKML